MKQKDICFADLNPTRGSEQGGQRPVVIISGDTMNDNLGICIVCPLSTKIKRYPGTVFIPKIAGNGLTENSEVISFQVRAIAKERLNPAIGQITQTELEKIIGSLNGLFEM
jgi:mRNA interferase MazF